MQNPKEINIGKPATFVFAVKNKGKTSAMGVLVEHFLMGDLTAVLALGAGSIWHAVGILSGRTVYPRWFVLFSPCGVLLLALVVGACLPAPFAGFVLAPLGTWFMLDPA